MAALDYSFVVHTDKADYVTGENVTVTIFVRKNSRPAPMESVRLFIFKPDGKKVYAAKLTTDNNGIAMGVYQLEKQSEPGSYYVEVQGINSMIALSTFLVI